MNQPNQDNINVAQNIKTAVTALSKYHTQHDTNIDKFSILVVLAGVTDVLSRLTIDAQEQNSDLHVNNVKFEVDNIIEFTKAVFDNVYSNDDVGFDKAACAKNISQWFSQSLKKQGIDKFLSYRDWIEMLVAYLTNDCQATTKLTIHERSKANNGKDETLTYEYALQFLGLKISCQFLTDTEICVNYEAKNKDNEPNNIIELIPMTTEAKMEFLDNNGNIIPADTLDDDADDIATGLAPLIGLANHVNAYLSATQIINDLLTIIDIESKDPAVFVTNNIC